MDDATLKSYLQMACDAKKVSHCPYSEKPCGAVIVSDKGTHKGCLIESCAYPSGTCAVANAIGAAICAGATEIKSCVLMGPDLKTFANPCGHCRQALFEFGDVPLYLGRTNDEGALDVSYKNSSVAVKMHGYEDDEFKSSPFSKKDYKLESCKSSSDLKSRYVWKTEGKVGELCTAAIDAAQHSYAPYSKFAVGAAVTTEKNTIFSGCNVENRLRGGGLCAECVAIGNAVANGAKKIKSIAIATVTTENPAMPCGRCRQLLVEFGDVTVYPLKMNFKDSTYEYEEKTSSMALLPHAFTAKTMKSLETPLTTAGSSKTSPSKSPLKK